MPFPEIKGPNGQELGTVGLAKVKPKAQISTICYAAAQDIRNFHRRVKGWFA